MIGLFRISYALRFIVRRSVSMDSYDRLDLTNYLLLNNVMAILGSLIAIQLTT